jgi:four helix bundle protein
MKMDEYGALIRTNELFDFVVDDMQTLKKEFGRERLAEQQMASADSIAANIKEGLGRGSRKEYTQCLVISRGSAKETLGRYGRMKRWLEKDIINSRQKFCNEIIAILSASIKTLRSRS